MYIGNTLPMSRIFRSLGQPHEAGTRVLPVEGHAVSSAAFEERHRDVQQSVAKLDFRLLLR